MAPYTVAKLRTRTGCLKCRERRKKCDEKRPRCTGCIRIKIVQCVWPLGIDKDDRRRRQCDKNNLDIDMLLTISPTISTRELRPPIPMPSPFHLQEHCYLYRYYCSIISPRHVRQNSLARFADQAYMLRMALQFAPLMGAMISIAGMHIAPLSYWTKCCAIESYTETIRGLRRAISQNIHAESDDAVLATIVLLTVFENCRVDSTVDVSPHLMASGFLLTRRQPQWPNYPQAKAVFDRICVESFVYHASLMMLFDPSLDVLSKISPHMDWNLYFSDSSSGEDLDTTTSSQPVLHTSYRFFLLIADITKLARECFPLIETELEVWRILNRQLLQWVKAMGTKEDPAAKLYIIAVKILLLKKDPDLSRLEIEEHIKTCFEKFLQILPSVDFNCYFPSTLLWPLAVVGSVASSVDERVALRDSICAIANSGRGSQAEWVYKRLENIWTRISNLGDIPSGRRRSLGLQALLDGI